MTFLEPWMLGGLLLAPLPIVIHLLNLRRHRKVEWGAMQFLLQATQRRRGHTRLRHLLILMARVTAIAALVFVVSRPLLGPWFGLFGTRPETVVVILDRSASMSEQEVPTGRSKLSAALDQLTTALRRAGMPRHLVLIESGAGQAQELASPEVLRELPATGATDAAANLPALLQSALDYLVANRAGRSDVWICSDLQAADWRSDSGQWAGLRSGFLELKPPVRFHLLSYPRASPDNASVRVKKLTRRRTASEDQLLLDLEIRRNERSPGVKLPFEIVVDGARSRVEIDVEGQLTRLTDHSVPLDRQRDSGWGKVELPGDANPRDNVFFFTYGNSIIRRTLVVSDEPGSAWPLRLAAAPPQDVSVAEAEVISPNDFAAADLRDISLVIWQAALPRRGSSQPLLDFVAVGGQVIFFPPAEADETEWLDHRWGSPARRLSDEGRQSIDQWRDDSGLLAHTDAGDPLPINRMVVREYRPIQGPGQVLARLHSGDPFLLRIPTDHGGVHFCAALAQEPFSNLARDGIVLFAMIQRALEAGTERLLASQFGEIDRSRSSLELPFGQCVEGWPEGRLSTEQPYVAGVYRIDERLVARNRPTSEETSARVSEDQLGALFAGLNYRLIQGSVQAGRSLVSEIWRGFVVLLLAVLIAESALCLPDVRPGKRVPV